MRQGNPKNAEAIFTEIGAEWDLAHTKKVLQMMPETVIMGRRL